ncbi:MAG TPA: acyl-CoA dehydrogenase family protein, partial [Candidatus Thalassarchaeaceae archaeon]|nr:acyl-CoA dehydrogenase family protein [Candidatus Thalassarchaeaceae archaeon]
MEISETEEQSMIREMVRGFAEEVLAPTCLQRDKGQEAPLDEWRAFCELGLQGITIAEQYGGSPVDDVTEAIIVEELARVDPSFS